MLFPQSVVDVGCGIGTWLSVFYEQGISDILGIDGAYVNRDQLLFPEEYFVACDLTKPLILPSDHRSSFDLAVSLEVAEHLPEESAAQFVASLVLLAPVVLFSAAIPHQGGTDHVNEQWPNYWAALFHDRGYVTIDWLRPQIWDNANVAYYYAQNSLLFVGEEHLAKYPELQGYIVAPEDAMLSRVHPFKGLEANNPHSQPLKKVLAALPYSAVNAVSRRLRRFVGKEGCCIALRSRGPIAGQRFRLWHRQWLAMGR
jgi:SAM-dependent methyltransferase